MAGRLAASAVVAIAICLLGAPAASAGPRPGERYDGRSATGQRSYLSVRADGSRLHHWAFVVSTPCTDGKTRTQGLLYPGERPVPIDAAGSFAYRSAAQRGAHRTRSGPVPGRLRLSFSGTFDGPGDSVTGTIRATFRGRRFDCSSGPVAFTLFRDGSAGAPWRDPVMATGIYTAQGRGVSARLRTIAPGRTLLRAAIRYRARCRAGGSLRSGRLFLDYGLTDDGRLRAAGRGAFRIPRDNVSVRIRFRLRLRFFEGTRVSGAWRLRARVFRGGRQIDTCRIRSPFAGGFQSGPA
jgi:hypothetical protein